MKLDGAVVFITGGAMGVGKGVAQALLEQGAKVTLADIATEDGEATASDFRKTFGEHRVFFVRCDVADETSFREAFIAAVSHFGNIDLMINNAGIVNEAKWKLMCAINMNGVVHGTQLAIEHMRKDQGGRGGVIINTASMVGLITRFMFPMYVASKHAVIGFTNSWANNPYLSSDMGIRIGTVCPTAIDTAFQRMKEGQVLYPAEFKEMLLRTTILEVSAVVEGYMKIIQDDDSNGKSMTISKNGIRYAHNSLVFE